MDTDDMPDLASVPNTRFLLKDETHRIIGCAFEVLNEIGHGCYERIYENALVVEFGLQGIPYEQQRRFDVLYKKHPVGFFVPDLIAFGQVIVDAKTIERITDEDRGKDAELLENCRSSCRPHIKLQTPQARIRAGSEMSIKTTDEHR